MSATQEGERFASTLGKPLGKAGIEAQVSYVGTASRQGSNEVEFQADRRVPPGNAEQMVQLACDPEFFYVVHSPERGPWTRRHDTQHVAEGEAD
jgi:hypothetical protein